jgi:hypothetical protein
MTLDSSLIDLGAKPPANTFTKPSCGKADDSQTVIQALSNRAVTRPL